MVKIYGVNGGPRKKWNTATMLNSFLEGAASVGEHVEVEAVHLFDLKYTGCVSCFACKREGSGYGKCTVKDDIFQLLQEMPLADGFVLATPIYFHDITAQLRGFLERLFFQFHSFEQGEETLAPKKLLSAMIYTMNVTEEIFNTDGYADNLEATQNYLEHTFGNRPELLYAFNTYEFTDYSKYKASYWNERDKADWKQRQFPLDCARAFEAGKRMAQKAGF